MIFKRQNIIGSLLLFVLIVCGACAAKKNPNIVPFRKDKLSYYINRYESLDPYFNHFYNDGYNINFFLPLLYRVDNSRYYNIERLENFNGLDQYTGFEIDLPVMFKIPNKYFIPEAVDYIFPINLNGIYSSDRFIGIILDKDQFLLIKRIDDLENILWGNKTEDELLVWQPDQYEVETILDELYCEEDSIANMISRLEKRPPSYFRWPSVNQTRAIKKGSAKKKNFAFSKNGCNVYLLNISMNPKPLLDTLSSSFHCYPGVWLEKENLTIPLSLIPKEMTKILSAGNITPYPILWINKRFLDDLSTELDWGRRENTDDEAINFPHTYDDMEDEIIYLYFHPSPGMRRELTD